MTCPDCGSAAIDIAGERMFVFPTTSTPVHCTTGGQSLELPATFYTPTAILLRTIDCRACGAAWQERRPS